MLSRDANNLKCAPNVVFFDGKFGEDILDQLIKTQQNLICFVILTPVSLIVTATVDGTKLLIGCLRPSHFQLQ